MGMSFSRGAWSIRASGGLKRSHRETIFTLSVSKAWEKSIVESKAGWRRRTRSANNAIWTKRSGLTARGDVAPIIAGRRELRLARFFV
jgi:hypothetical protein